MKHFGMKRVLALSLAAAMCFSLLPVGAMASEEMPAAGLVEERIPLPEETISEAEPVTDGVAEEPAPEAETDILPEEEEAPAEEAVRFSWINPLYADVIPEEDLPQSDSVSLDGAAPSFSTAKAAGAYVREQLIARNEEIIFVCYGDVDAALDEALAHTGDPKAGDSIVYQLGRWDGTIYSDGTVVLSVLYYTTAAQEAATDAKVAQIKDSLNLPEASDYETVKAVHDYLCDTVTYAEDYEAAEARGDMTHYTTWGALVNRDCVCQGYSLAMYRLMLECGIDCRIVCGEGHAWNIVQLGDLYYSVDATWDGDGGGWGDYYFLRGKTVFYEDHEPTTDVFRNDMSFGSAFWNNYPMSLTDYDPDAVPINAANFPDEKFRAYVSGYLDENGDGQLSPAEMESVIALDCDGLGIKDLTGVEHFGELVFLYCGHNALETLDVSGLKDLCVLECSGNALTELDVSGCAGLEELWAQGNALTELNLTGNPALENLLASGYITEKDGVESWMDSGAAALKIDSGVKVTLAEGILLNRGNVPDENFRLLLRDGIDPDGSGYMTLGEADEVTEADCAGWGIADFTGLSLFPNLSRLDCRDNAIEELDLRETPTLETVYRKGERIDGDGFVVYVYEEMDGVLMVDAGVSVRAEKSGADVNGDGATDRDDALAVLRHVVGAEILTGEALAVADTTGNGAVDVRDAAQILRFACGQPSGIR